jgi:hypothetical protein
VHELAWDNIQNSSDSTVSDVKSIMAKAFKGPLAINQQQTLYAALAADQKIVYHTGLTPNKVSS